MMPRCESPAALRAFLSRTSTPTNLQALRGIVRVQWSRSQELGVACGHQLAKSWVDGLAAQSGQRKAWARQARLGPRRCGFADRATLGRTGRIGAAGVTAQCSRGASAKTDGAKLESSQPLAADNQTAAKHLCCTSSRRVRRRRKDRCSRTYRRSLSTTPSVIVCAKSAARFHGRRLPLNWGLFNRDEAA